MLKIGQASRKTLTIPKNGAVSDALELNGQAVVAVYMPAAWTAADLALQVSVTGADHDWHDLYWEGAKVALTVGAGHAVAVDPKYTLGHNYVRLRSVDEEGEEPQADARAITVVYRPIGS